jgi:hypothetical protein
LYKMKQQLIAVIAATVTGQKQSPENNYRL